MAYLAGTGGSDTLAGGAGDDQILGQGGADSLSGGAGNDQLIGGDGIDTLDGGDGDDRLQDDDASGEMFGGAGVDVLLSTQSSMFSRGGARLMDGGDGDDVIGMRLPSGSGSATLIGGAGNDQISAIGNIGGVIDAGPGADLVTLADDATSRLAQALSITLGEGADRLRWGLNPALSGAVTITDFQTGDAGDRILIALDIFLAGWDGQTNPFASGFFQLAQVGADAVLRIDYDGAAGSGGQLRDIIRFQNVQVSAFTAFNTFDWQASGSAAPGASNVGTDNADQLIGGSGDDLLFGLGGGDYILGGAGADTLDGGLGDDDVEGGLGSDNVMGGAGDDLLFGDVPNGVVGGDDTLQGGDGRDVTAET